MHGIALHTPDDAHALARLGQETFVETFGTLYSAQNLHSFLSTTYDVEHIAAGLNDPTQHLQVAQVAGVWVGYCRLVSCTTLPIPQAPGEVFELKQFYVRQSHHRMGVGAALMAWSLERARHLGAHALVLSVWSGNTRAQNFYHRYGFKKIGDHFFMVGEHRDDEFLYLCPLKSGTYAAAAPWSETAQ